MVGYAFWLIKCPIHLLRSLIGKSVVVYFDDILVYSKSIEEHVTHVKEVLQILRHEKLYANLPKCTCAKDKLIFLGFVMSSNGIEVDVSKVKDIRDWPVPTNVSELRTFHGLAGFLPSLCERLFYHCLPSQRIDQEKCHIRLGKSTTKGI